MPNWMDTTLSPPPTNGLRRVYGSTESTSSTELQQLLESAMPPPPAPALQQPHQQQSAHNTRVGIAATGASSSHFGDNKENFPIQKQTWSAILQRHRALQAPPQSKSNHQHLAQAGGNDGESREKRHCTGLVLSARNANVPISNLYINNSSIVRKNSAFRPAPPSLLPKGEKQLNWHHHRIQGKHLESGSGSSNSSNNSNSNFVSGAAANDIGNFGGGNMTICCPDSGSKKRNRNHDVEFSVLIPPDLVTSLAAEKEDRPPKARRNRVWFADLGPPEENKYDKGEEVATAVPSSSLPPISVPRPPVQLRQLNSAPTGHSAIISEPHPPPPAQQQQFLRRPLLRIDQQAQPHRQMVQPRLQPTTNLGTNPFQREGQWFPRGTRRPSPRIDPEIREKLRETFRILDAESRGIVSFEALMQALRAIGTNSSKRELRQRIQRSTPDTDRIDIATFVEVISEFCVTEPFILRDLPTLVQASAFGNKK